MTKDKATVERVALVERLRVRGVLIKACAEAADLIEAQADIIASLTTDNSGKELEVTGAMIEAGFKARQRAIERHAQMTETLADIYTAMRSAGQAADNGAQPLGDQSNA